MKDRHSFNLWKPTFNCQTSGRSGGDGTRDICAWSTYTNRNPCLIYSLGSNLDFQFENFVRGHTKNCMIHTFDCTIKDPNWKSARLVDNSGRVFFHPICISAVDGDPNDKFLTIESIMKQLNHTPNSVSLMKIDIEAYEHRIINSWNFSNKFLPEQITIEVHSTTEPQTSKYRYKSIGELTNEYIHFVMLGYRLVSSYWEGGGIGATLMRVFCPK